MKFSLETRSILEQAEPEDRLDAIWCKLLATDYGTRLLEAWDLDLSQVIASAPLILFPRERLLQSAHMLGGLLAPHECAEWVAENLLTSRPDWTGPALDEFSGLQIHEIENDLIFALAFEDGLEEPEERHALQAARQVWPQMDRLLEFAPRPLAQYTKKYTPRILAPGPVEPVQLALACTRCEELGDWMAELGVARWRVFATITDLEERWTRSRVSSKKLSWLGPACEEAQVVKTALVGPDHLLLALMGKPRGLVSRVLQELGLDPKLLRRRLSDNQGEAVKVAQMSFTPELLSICQAACQRDGKDPYSETLFEELLKHYQMPEIPVESALEALNKKLQGSLPRDPERLSLDGLRLGMSEAEVLALWGEPSFRRGTDWLYKNGGVVFHERQLKRVHGRCLEVDGQPALRKRDRWLEAEKLLGARYLWRGQKDLAFALISRGRVSILALGRPEV